MPYKDRETYLRKQREFYYRRKAHAQRTSPIRPASRVSHTLIPLTRLTPQVAAQEERASVFTPDPNRGIALRFQPAAKEKFQVDDCGNAWRIVRPDES
jgi:hypothetical protein